MSYYLISFFSISSACEQGFIDVASSPQGSCLDILGLVGLLTAESVVLPLETWLDNACAQPACTQADLNASATTIVEACQYDLDSQSFQLNDGSKEELVLTVQQSYGLVQSVLCVKKFVFNAQVKRNFMFLTEYSV